MSDTEPPQQVSAVEIARLAGVGRAAVSNWRRRHSDFPRPVGGSETSPAFSLAEVEDWLRAQGKIAEVPLLERVRRRIELLRDPAAPAAAPLVPALAQLLLLRRDPARWRALSALDDLVLAEALPDALAEQVRHTLGPQGPRLLRLPALFGSTQLELARLLAELVAAQGVPRTAADLLAGAAAANRQAAAVSPPVADLLAELAGTDRAAHYLDPACGNGALLRGAARHGATALHGQEADPALAAVALLRIALDAPEDRPAPLPVGIATGDALRDDAWPTLLADAVLSRPPYNERNWGADELGYDPRWEYGLPARAESELAWVQHALARVRPGGLVTLLLPGAVAARRSGRRIRAELLRRGALRAVAALPAGVTAPYPAALHIWLLRRPAPGETAPGTVLLVDAGNDGDRFADTVLEAWRGSGAGGTDRPGRYRAVPVIDLLDDETDLTPARHLPQHPADAHGELTERRRRLDALFAELAPLRRSLPDCAPPGDDPDADPAHRAVTTVGELVRGGALELLAEGERPRPGDVVVPGPGGGPVTVHGPDRPDGPDGGADPLGAQLLRPDQGVLDAWFLAGLLDAARIERTVSTTATGSGTSLRDLRRTRVPRLPLVEQRRYAEPFRQLADFRRRLRTAAELGEQLAQGITSGLADGGLSPTGPVPPASAG